jgi:hypothetical protein
MFKKYFRNIDKTKIMGRLAGSLLAIILFTFVPPLQIAYAAQTPPPVTTSWYMDTPNVTSLPAIGRNKGCALGTHDEQTQGTQDNLVILLFGSPAYINGIYGTNTWISMGNSVTVFVSTTQIAETVEEFGRTYWQCAGSDTGSQLTIAVGVNNIGSAVTYQHGSAWAVMVKNIDSYLSANGYASQVHVKAAGDMELDFNDATHTRAWVDGYKASYKTDLSLYNVGTSDGCPYPAQPNWVCGTIKHINWGSENVWYISWGATPAYPLPEIYLTNGVNAGQWYFLSLYGYTKHNQRLSFQGSLTQLQACSQTGGCPGLNNIPANGWKQLWNMLQSDTKTSIPALHWSTDIRWR